MALITFSILLLLMAACTTSSRSNEVMIGEEVSDHVSSQYSWTIALDITNNTDKAIRLTVSSTAANLSQPLFISVRQGRHISSLTIPYVEAGHSYSQVSRTLCSLLNQPLHSLSSHMIYIDISSPAHINISFNIMSEIVTDYNLRLNSPFTTNVSISSPIVHVFEYPVNVDRVLVKVTSLSLICGLVSVQTDLCPVDQLLDSTDHRGVYQSVQQLAAINIKRPAHQNFIYIVITLYHHGNCSDINYDFIDGLVTFNRSANYDPARIHDDQLLTKTVTIEIGHTLSSSQYAVAIAVPSLIMLAIIFGACFWIIADELFCYRCHSINEFLSNEFEKLLKEDEEQVDFSIEEGRGKVKEEGRGKKIKGKCLWFLSFLIGKQWLHEVKKTTVPSTANSTAIKTSARCERADVTSNISDVTIDQRREQSTEEEEEPDGGVLIHVERRHNKKEDVISKEEKDEETSASLTTSPLKRQNSYILAIIETHSHTSQETHSHTSQETHSHTSQETHSHTRQETHSHTSQETHSHTSQKTHSHRPQYISNLKFPEGKAFQKKYEGYWAYLLVIVIFYSLPVYQLVLTYQRFLMVSGNGDFCYYNSLCSHPLLGVSSFNNIWSNIGFFINGILIIIIARRRRSRYKLYEFINESFDNINKSEEKRGVPQYFGIYYAAGISLMGEAVMSAAYHICPTGSNYQFDTAMMFLLVTLGLYQLFKCRNPDITPSPHKLLLVLSLLILFIGLGVIYNGLIFYIVFFCIFEAGVIYTSLQIYYRWKFKLKISNIPSRLKIISLYVLKLISQLLPFTTGRLRSCTVQVPWPPHDKTRFVYLVLSNIINFLGAVCLVSAQPADFATNFLNIMIGNFMVSLIFHFVIKAIYHNCCNCGRARAIAKEIYHDCCNCGRAKAIAKAIYRCGRASAIKPVTYLIVSLIFWIIGIVFYSMSVTDWLESPAGSRNNNRECLVLGFYDSHDLWHFFSSFGLFFAFLLLMTFEDHVELEKRSGIRIY